jgi:hypothetical protein
MEKSSSDRWLGDRGKRFLFWTAAGALLIYGGYVWGSNEVASLSSELSLSPDVSGTSEGIRESIASLGIEGVVDPNSLTAVNDEIIASGLETSLPDIVEIQAQTGSELLAAAKRC